MLAGQDEVAVWIACYSDEAPTFGMPLKMGVAASVPFGIGLGSKNPGATTLIHYSWGSLALMMHLGAWKL